MERFKIISKIGEGAYSTVYTVKRLEDDKVYALKKVKIQKLSPKEKNNALNEVRILASVNSPYIISYKESFIDEEDQTLCIVMEYADDGDLFQKIKFYKSYKTFFMEEDIWRIFIQITKGLHDLHEFNILHRDLKSANVFLFRDGTAKLGDLNVSKITCRGLGCTQTGTPYYASPEIWKDNPYNLKSDIWSLGCVFYELIMLKTPFRGKSMKDLYKKVMKGEYPPIPNTFSNKFQIVIDRILKVRPEERPDTNEILAMDEIVYKIEELNIFKKEKKPEKIKIKNICFNTAYKICKRKILNRNKTDLLGEPNNNEINEINKDINDDLMITNLKYPLQIKKEKILNINKSCEIKNNKNTNFKLFPINNKKEEILNIYKKNIEHFKEKYNQKKKLVINTIKYPLKLSQLNNKLPDVKYEEDGNANINNNLNPYPKVFLSPHQFLPKIKNYKICPSNNLENNIKNEENIQEIEESKNTIIKKNYKINSNENKKFIMKTLQMKINQKHPFDYKGKIDIIIEE